MSNEIDCIFHKDFFTATEIAIEMNPSTTINSFSGKSQLNCTRYLKFIGRKLFLDQAPSFIKRFWFCPEKASQLRMTLPSTDDIFATIFRDSGLPLKSSHMTLLLPVVTWSCLKATRCWIEIKVGSRNHLRREVLWKFAWSADRLSFSSLSLDGSTCAKKRQFMRADCLRQLLSFFSSFSNPLRLDLKLIETFLSKIRTCEGLRLSESFCSLLRQRKTQNYIWSTQNTKIFKYKTKKINVSRFYEI